MQFAGLLRYKLFSLDNNTTASQILAKIRNKTVSEEDLRWMDEWLKQDDDGSRTNMLNSGLSVSASWTSAPDESYIQDLGYLAAGILQADKQPVAAIDSASKPVSSVHRVHFLNTAWFRYAAILLLIAGTAAYLYSSRKAPEIVQTTPARTVTDIMPGGNNAILTLADGRIITLDSAGTGTLAEQGNTRILKLNTGSLAYQPGTPGGTVLYNTISTPKGGQYQITLPDGTNVWLNAASSIRFPTVFTKDRTVEVTGESFFEVAVDKSKPFRVKAGTIAVEVLGTSFNINAYADENTLKTTLIEGAVKVAETQATGVKAAILKPGQQAAITADRQMKVMEADLQQTLAWKNGFFNLTNQDFKTLMRQLERWYNVEVTYVNTPPSIEFAGKIDRGSKLSGVIRFLQENGIDVRLDGRTLVITGK